MSQTNANVAINLTTLASGTTAPLVTSNLNLFIAPTAFYSQVTTSTNTNNAITLPINPILGQTYTIRNDASALVQVFTPTTTSFMNMLGGISAGPYSLNDGSVSFIAVSNNGVANTASGANPYNNPAIIYHEVSTNVSNQVVALPGGTATIPVPLSAAGTIYTVASTTAQQLNLPTTATSAGTYYKFVARAANPGAATTIHADAAIVSGIIQCANAVVACAAVTNVVMATAPLLIGDYVELTCDGTRWFVNARSFTALGITTS